MSPERAAPDRGATIEAFLAAAGWRGAERHALPGDASFRRYHRLSLGGRGAMLMDAPPGREDVRPYVRVARLLRQFGFSAPEILAEDPARGLLVIEDFGDDTYTRLLARGHDEAALYRLAVDLLAELHRRFRPGDGAAIPPYDDERLLAEASLLTDWFLPAATGSATPASARDEYLALWRGLFPVARAVPATLVLRDYHIDNLMLLPGRAGVAACGVLDFQDAVVGPVSYDLVSLLEDARRDIAPGLVAAMYRRYLEAAPAVDRDAFAASCAVMGAQRNAKIVGIFTRLRVRDGKRSYLAHIPRVWRLLEGDLRHPALAPMRAWFDRSVPAPLRAVPRSLAA
ncbi:MAG: phosphotransferase [Alphaproteobacteria bacterium]|nr:phosphotransferase [Alphaproteobacteria bacterium]